jgi:hypothetical protein
MIKATAIFASLALLTLVSQASAAIVTVTYTGSIYSGYDTRPASLAAIPAEI